MITKCPFCSQLLDIPDHIGGMLMACPTCGKQLYSDFKIKTAKAASGSVQRREENTAASPQKAVGGFSVKV